MDFAKLPAVSVPGSCGELVQGIIDGELCLVTCPIELFSTAAWQVAVQEPLPQKACAAVQQFAQLQQIALPLQQMTLHSQLLRGKGMSSSSADIAAAVKLAAITAKLDYSEELLALLAAQIEPTDGVFCQGIVTFCHREGRILERLGTPPPLRLVIFDCGGSVDTVVFNQRQDLYQLNCRKMPLVKDALATIHYGMRHQDCEAIGRGATMSALANQSILPKRFLPALVQLVKNYQGLGVCAAHSGTLLGAMFAPTVTELFLADFCLAVLECYPELQHVATTRLIAGGFYYER